MAAIDTYLQQIRTAVYGRDVRSAIANGIEECYAYVSNYTPSALSDYVTKDSLNEYLSKEEAQISYVMPSALNDYLTIASAQIGYATKEELGDYITRTTADAKYALKDSLNDYLTTETARDVYFTKEAAEVCITQSDIASYVTRTEADDLYLPISMIDSIATKDQLDDYSTTESIENRFVLWSDFARYKSFEYKICPSNSAEIPDGVTDAFGIIGSMEPSAATLNTIYFVRHSSIERDKYDEYMTIQTGENIYAWEKIGGSSSGSSGENSGGGSNDIDLSSYITFGEAVGIFAGKEDIEDFISETTADDKYALKSELRDAIAEIKGTDGIVTYDTLKYYLKQVDADEMYAAQSDLTKTKNEIMADVDGAYATKAYVNAQIVTYPTGENILLMLEVDDIPGTTQSIVYNSDTGDIARIIHVKDGTNYRVDSFVFEDNLITETRTLTTGQKLTLVTDTTTSVTTTTYTAA